MIAVEGRLATMLPRMPHRAHCLDVLAHPRPRWRPAHTVAALDVAAHLCAETEREAPVRQCLQGPGAHRGDGRAARESDRDRGTETDACRRLRGEAEHDERIVLGLFEHQPVVSEGLDPGGVARDALDVETRARFAQPRVDLAEG